MSGSPPGPAPGHAAGCATAGATRSGFWRPSTVGPQEENDATSTGAGSTGRGRRATVKPGSSPARCARAAPWREPRPTTGMAMPASPATAGKLEGPPSSHTASAAAPAAAACAALSAMLPPPRATTTRAPRTRLAPAASR